ncbi:MAG: iron-containing alcohol dehydrogenase [Hahellaceae bacterium]|nr:iron-containing alcohol dehydrogenase [Hahellaceae bacterium]MCP5212640.1 iron-containing alcohol dehydrogenase [Hahellaceae bacterium]
MLNFSYLNSTQIHFGEGQIATIVREIPADARVLVLYGGGSIKKNGVYTQVSEALSQHEWFEFAGIEPNPQYETLIKALPLIKEKQIHYLLAVGGGSVIDGSKFIAAAALFEGEEPWDIIAKRGKIKAALPLGVIVTLPATGSESNNGAVITRNGQKLPLNHPLIRPRFAILDPSLTLSLSPRQIGNGVVDAFVHTIEQYLTYPVNAKVQDRFAEGLLLTLIEEGPKALAPKTQDDISVRGNIMWAASLALNGLIGAGVPQDWATHMIGHELTAEFGVDHARTLSIILPATLKVRRESKREKLLQYAARVWQLQEGDEEQRINDAIRLTEKFFRKMDLPTRLADVGIESSDIENIISRLQAHRMTRLGERREVTLDISREILQMAL